MENRNIIIILLVVIVILAAAIGVMMFNTSHAKEATKIKITSDKEQYEGGKLSIELTDLNKTPLSKEIVNVTITNKKGKVVVDDVVKTNSKGKAKLDLDLKKGKYNVTVSYGGNENYTGTNETQKLSIKEKVTEAVKSQSSSSQSSSQSSQRQEYEITPDGWNPREHEVSRESIGNGYERVNYDDGYMRVVDKDGNVISHGF
ncbi:type IV pilin [Methanobrevibacter sp.]|uniref:type IV pilin n=1 Tax=Methanobrevibacter sp. TaxID=66852 RepID=UPI0038677D44